MVFLNALTGLYQWCGSFQTQQKRAHDHQWTFGIVKTTASNIWLVMDRIVTLITSHTGIACHVKRNFSRHVASPRFQSVDQWWVCMCRALSLSVLRLLRCLEGITFETEWLLMDQHQIKIPDFFTAKWCKIMNLRLLLTVWIWQLLVWCTIVIASVNSFCFCISLLLGPKCVQFKWFLPLS